MWSNFTPTWKVCTATQEDGMVRSGGEGSQVHSEDYLSSCVVAEGVTCLNFFKGGLRRWLSEEVIGLRPKTGWRMRPRLAVASLWAGW